MRVRKSPVLGSIYNDSHQDDKTFLFSLKGIGWIMGRCHLRTGESFRVP